MSQTSPKTVTVETLPSIVHQGANVITTELLAGLYGTDRKNIQDNFAYNETRFEHGKHYFKLTGQDLRNLKHKPEISGLVAKNARHLILWTERGAARHAKMLDTEQAWEVFEKLEDAYFRPPAAPAPAKAIEPPSPAAAHSKEFCEASARAHRVVIEYWTTIRDLLLEGIQPPSPEQLDALLRAPKAASKPLFHPDQTAQLQQRMDRVMAIFHPMSDQMADLRGIVRILHGHDPRLGQPVAKWASIG